MGQRMPDEPYEIGDDCLNCFAPGETPKYGWARFSMIQTCPDKNGHACSIAPNDRVFKLTQSEFQPCLYEFTDAQWTARYYHHLAGPPRSRLELWDSGGFGYFYQLGADCAGEGIVFQNNLVGCGLFQCGQLGIGIFTWTENASVLLSAINMAKSNSLFMELWPTEDGKNVYKFCNLEDSTNVKILFDPEL